MSVSLEIKDPAGGKPQKTEIPVVELVKSTQAHKGSALIASIAMYVSYATIWVMMLLFFIAVPEMIVFIIPHVILLVLGLMGAFFWGWGWKGKNLLKFVGRKKATTPVALTSFK